jgi:hypothetical protein
MHSVDCPGFFGGCDLWESWGSWYPGSRIPLSCGNGQCKWSSSCVRRQGTRVGRSPGSAIGSASTLGNGSLRGIAADRAFADYVDAARLCREIDDGLVSWKDILPDLKCSDPQDEARKITRGRAARALAVLVHGDLSVADEGACR